MISKEECVKLHRQMWNWIADQIEKEQRFDNNLYKLKKLFWKEFGILPEITDPDLYKFCFCCLYAYQKNDTDAYENAVTGCRACKDCLMNWNANGNKHQCSEKTAEYTFFNEIKKNKSTWQEVANQCRKVANLTVNGNV